VAHSDGDAVAHAVTDALLGAACLGDIGTHFPDTDPRWAGADSIVLLERVITLLDEKGMRPVHADITVVLETPKLGRHRAAITERLAAALRLSVGRVSLKAKTNEGMGFIGRGEGVAVLAVVTVEGP
jgi:2-C-methyl-D-erythritol 2,4-cyclodiphosphate synthase